MKPPIFVSFYTNDFYHKLAMRLRRSLKLFGLEHEIQERPHRETWLENIFQKVDFLREMSERHPDRSLYWIDADCQVRQLPDVAQFDGYDLAAVEYKFMSLHGGCFWIANNEKTPWLLEKWEAMNRIRPGFPDDWNLSTVIEEDACDRVPIFRVKILPLEYCWTEKWLRPRKPDAVPVIEQEMVYTMRHSYLPGEIVIDA